MIIPVKCFTCGKVIGDKYNYYLKRVKAKKEELNILDEEIQYLEDSSMEKSPEGIILDELNFNSICCRRHFLTHVNIFH